MNVELDKKNFDILFLSIYESPTLTNVRNYILSKTQSKFDFMIFGLLANKNNKTYKDVYFVRSNGEKINKSASYKFCLKTPFLELFQFFSQLKVFFVLLKIIKNKKYDICIAQTPTLAVLGLLLKKIGKCKMTIAHVTDIYNEENKGFINNILISVQKLLRRIAYKNDFIWYQHEGVKKWDEKRGFVTNNFFIEGESFDFEEVQRSLGVKKKTNQVCYVGRMDKYSGLDIAIKSIKLIRDKIPDIFLAVIGGYLEKDIIYYKKLANQEGVSDAVKFFGYIPDKNDVKKIIAESVLGFAIYSPDKKNGVLYTIPGKVLDYLQAGVPVVITKQGPQVKDEINKYNAGILVEYDTKDIVNKVTNVLLQKDKLKELQDGVLKLTCNLGHDKIQLKLYNKFVEVYGNFAKIKD